MLKKSYCTIIMMAVPMMVYFILAAKPSIIFLSGAEYTEAAKPMRILMPIMLITSLSNITGMQILIPTSGEWKFAVSVTCGAIVDMILNAIFIPKMGANGAAIGTLFAELTQFCVQIFFTRNYIRGAISVRGTAQVVIATTLGALGYYGVSLMLHVSVFTTLFVTASVFFCIYAVVLLAFRYEMLVELLGLVCDIILKKLKRK